MPLYEYQCDGKCGQRFEVIQKFSDPPVKKCPNCGGKVHKLLSSPAIQFKGSGWYITDYARKSGVSADTKSTSEKSEKSEKTDKADKTEKPAEKKSTDTTPASAPSTKDK